MGYSVPQTIFGWYATTNQLIYDAVDKTNNTSTYILKKTMYQQEPITGYLRVQYDLSDLGGTAWGKLTYWDGVTDTTLHEDNAVARTTFTHDISPSWTKGGEIRIYLKDVGGGNATLDEIYLLGERCPFYE